MIKVQQKHVRNMKYMPGTRWTITGLVKAYKSGKHMIDYDMRVDAMEVVVLFPSNESIIFSFEGMTYLFYWPHEVIVKH